jgi:predicted phage tail protein
MPAAGLAGTTILDSAIRKLYSFLLLDQYDSGIWGASLQKSEILYGARSDPGSITVSVACSMALQAVSDMLSPPPLRRFRDYLVSRRSRDGAFGMRHSELARGVPVEEIREHTRHTATGAMLFLHMDGPEHDYVTAAARYLLDPTRRTPSGYWAEEAGGPDERADPITAAYVVSLFESLRASIEGRALSRRYPISDPEIDAAIERGLDYLFKACRRTDKGGWVYRHKSEEEYRRVLTNEYAYTADVLKMTAPAIARTGRHIELFVEIMEMLRHVSRSRGGGIPPGRDSNVPDLTATADLADAAKHCTLFAGEAEEMRRAVRALAELPEVFEAAAANGWAAALRAHHDDHPEFNVSRSEQVEWAGEVARIELGERPTGAFWNTIFGEHKDFIDSLLRTKVMVAAAPR